MNVCEMVQIFHEVKIKCPIQQDKAMLNTTFHLSHQENI